MKKNNEKFIKELEKAGIEDAKQFLEKNILPIMKKEKKTLYKHCKNIEALTKMWRQVFTSHCTYRNWRCKN
jgi:hypothetical protein